MCDQDGRRPHRRQTVERAAEKYYYGGATSSTREAPCLPPRRYPDRKEGDGAGGMRGRRKRRPPCNGADRAAVRRRYPTRKGADVRLVLAVKNLSSARSIGEVRR